MASPSIPTTPTVSGATQPAAGSQFAGKVSILTGGFDRPYVFGIVTALAAKRLSIEVIGSDWVDGPEMHDTPGLEFRNLQRGWRAECGRVQKLLRVAIFYLRLLAYAVTTKAKVFHILWNNKVAYFDRTLLMLIYKAIGKRIALTAHNVNTATRDGTDTALNRFTLRFQYRLMDTIFVHTQEMRRELIDGYGVRPAAVTVIPFGINNAVPQTGMSVSAAKSRLGIEPDERTMLFFGRIQPYKGLEHLIAAIEQLVQRERGPHRLIIAGEPKKETQAYWSGIEEKLNRGIAGDSVLKKIQFIPDSEAEIYFKAADVLILPYVQIYQSGVLFLAYSFGLPVIATDVGSFREDIEVGQTGFLCRPSDPVSLADAIETYFDSDLYRNLDRGRVEIRDRARARNSWETVAEMTIASYAAMSSGSGTKHQ